MSKKMKSYKKIQRKNKKYSVKNKKTGVEIMEIMVLMNKFKPGIPCF